MDQEVFIRTLENFGKRLYAIINEKTREENIVLSPFSIQTSTSMVLMGAENETANELYRGLGYDISNVDALAQHYYKILSEFEDSTILKIANKIYVKDDFKICNTFNDIIKQKFSSEIENVDFVESEKAADTINSWIADKTNHCIEHLISHNDLDETTCLLLLNVIHFKAKWLHEFSKQLTENKKFYIDEDTTVIVPMMRIKRNFYYGENQLLDAKVLEMPYYNSTFTMLIFLPNKRTGLSDLQHKLNSIAVKDILNNMDHTTVNVELPKFKVEFQMELTDAFKKLGMERMFSLEAQFGRISETNKPVRVSKVIHKAFIEVDEEGTEAAAATVVSVRKRRAVLDDNMPKDFIIDHPFYYIIKQKVLNHDSFVLFMGSVINPAEGAGVKSIVSESIHDEL